MADSMHGFGLGGRGALGPPGGGPGVEHVVVLNRLRKVLAFTGFSIDDIVNDPIARNTVRGYFKLAKWVDRQSEVSDLERQWNPRRL